MESFYFFILLICYYDLKDEIKRNNNAIHAVNNEKLKGLDI